MIQNFFPIQNTQQNHSLPFLDGMAYCLVKSCPLGDGGISYNDIIRTGFSPINFDEPQTVVVLPSEQIQLNGAGGQAMAKLRSILSSEAPMLDIKHRRVWRLQLDALAVMSKLGELGFATSQFGVNAADGVHTWTLSYQQPASNIGNSDTSSSGVGNVVGSVQHSAENLTVSHQHGMAVEGARADSADPVNWRKRHARHTRNNTTPEQEVGGGVNTAVYGGFPSSQQHQGNYSNNNMDHKASMPAYHSMPPASEAKPMNNNNVQNYNTGTSSNNNNILELPVAPTARPKRRSSNTLHHVVQAVSMAPPPPASSYAIDHTLQQQDSPNQLYTTTTPSASTAALNASQSGGTAATATTSPPAAAVESNDMTTVPSPTTSTRRRLRKRKTIAVVETKPAVQQVKQKQQQKVVAVVAKRRCRPLTGSMLDLRTTYLPSSITTPTDDPLLFLSRIEQYLTQHPEYGLKTHWFSCGALTDQRWVGYFKCINEAKRLAKRRKPKSYGSGGGRKSKSSGGTVNSTDLQSRKSADTDADGEGAAGNADDDDGKGKSSEHLQCIARIAVQRDRTTQKVHIFYERIVHNCGLTPAVETVANAADDAGSNIITDNIIMDETTLKVAVASPPAAVPPTRITAAERLKIMGAGSNIINSSSGGGSGTGYEVELYGEARFEAPPIIVSTTTAAAAVAATSMAAAAPTTKYVSLVHRN